MKNEYMFFNEETFTGVDIEEYIKTDILIPETSIYMCLNAKIRQKKSCVRQRS